MELSVKTRLGRQNESKANDRVEKIIFVFDEPFLRTFQEKHKITAARFKADEPFLRIADNDLVPHFIHSLLPYYNANGQIDQAFFLM